METAKNLRQANVAETHERKFNFDFLEKYLLEFYEIYDELKGTLSLFNKTKYFVLRLYDWVCAALRMLRML